MGGVKSTIGCYFKAYERVVMFGTDEGGKTTLLYQLKRGEVIRTTPTVGFNVENIDYKDLRLTIWDVGGQQVLRKLWYHYYQGNSVVLLIMVVDSTSVERIEETKTELQNLVAEKELRNVPILVYANKQDDPRALPPHEISLMLELDSIPESNSWKIQGCSAIENTGILEGLDWFAEGCPPNVREMAFKTAKSANSAQNNN